MKGLKLIKTFYRFILIPFRKIFIACLVFVFTSSSFLFAQEMDTINDSYGYIDQTDLIKVIRGKNSKRKSTGIPEKGKLIAFAAPIFGSNPSLGTFYGLGGAGAIYLGEPENTSISNINTSLMYTTKNQFIGAVKAILMTNENLWEMLIDVKYSIFSEGTYGLGSDYNQPIKEGWNIGGIHTEGISGIQQINFNYI